MGMGRSLITAGGRQLAKRIGLPAISSADDFIPQLDFIPMGASSAQLVEVPPQLSLDRRLRALVTIQIFQALTSHDVVAARSSSG